MRADSRRLEELVARGRDEVARVRDTLRETQQQLHERQLALQRTQQELGDVQHAVRHRFCFCFCLSSLRSAPLTTNSYSATARSQNEKHVQQLQLEATQMRELLAEQQTEKERVQEHLHELNNEMSSKVAQIDSLQRNVRCAQRFLTLMNMRWFLYEC